MAVLTGCHEELAEPARLEMSLCLPAQDMQRSNIRRMPGDPGTTEHFAFPKYAYLFVMKQEGGTWTVWRRDSLQLSEDDWEATRYYGMHSDREDSIYKYKQPIQYLLQNESPQGRVYAICSNKKLTFNKAPKDINDLEDLMNWKFRTAPDSIQEDLQNIYSTPYNYNRSEGYYYCTFDCSSGHSFHVDLLLYHVAAKVDIKWNVVDSVRINKAHPEEAVRLTYMDACCLYNGDAYCFRPMENSVASAPLSSGRTVHLVRPTDEGLWWEGRAYFYAIPYTVDNGNYFPLQMIMETNNSGDQYKPTLYLQIDRTDVFVPWLRANFNLSKPLEAKEETKQLDN